MTRPETSPIAADPPLGLTCPTCGYDLNGLTTPRCPECGLAFQWADLIESRRAGPRWLFERAARPWAFLQTYARTGLPWHFWRRVTRENPVRLGRLVLYWFLVSLPLISIAGGTSLGLLVGLVETDLANRRRLTTALQRSTPQRPAYADFSRTTVLTAAVIDADYPVPWSPAFARRAAGELAREIGGPRVAAAAVPGLWPWLTAATLLLAFRSSLRRAGVSAADVVRASVYGCDFGLLAIAVAGTFYSVRDLGTVANDGLNALFRADLFGRDAPLLGLMIVATSALATARMTFAAGRYLRLGQPLRTVLAAQAIVVAAVVAVLVLILPRH